MSTCSICDAAVPPDEVIYAKTGDVLCLGCHRLSEWSAQIGRAADSAKASGTGYFSGRPPVVHPVNACASCSAPLAPRQGHYSVKTWKQTGKPKVLCAACDEAELAELAAQNTMTVREAIITLAVFVGLVIIGVVIYFVVTGGS